MRRIVARTWLWFFAAGAFAATARADDWTSPKEVATSAKAFASATETLQKAIKDVDKESPLVVEVGSLSKTTSKFTTRSIREPRLKRRRRTSARLRAGTHSSRRT